MNNQLIENKIIGAMLGLACGDALGAPAEFKNKTYIQSKWGKLTEMIGGGMWQPGEWTDDTGMTLCIAEGILAQPEDPIQETGKRFLEWNKTTKDVGTTISAALSAFRGDWVAAAKSTPQAKQGMAAGNGSLMRTLPVALGYGSDRTAMLQIAARLSAMTHWDSQAETGCVIYCLWIANILEGQELHPAWQAALKEARVFALRDHWTPDTPGGQGTFSTHFWERLGAVETLTYQQLQPSGYAGYVVECLEAAAWCCLNSSSLEEALVQVVNLAGEADTMAAVAGGVAGAFWGVESLPPRWLNKLHQRAYLETTAKRLAVLRRHTQVYATDGLKPFESNWVTDRIRAGRNPLTRRDVQVLSGMGITHILDLREPHEWTPPKFGSEALEEIERTGLPRLHLLVKDMQAPSAETLDRAYQFIDEALQDPRHRVYVHCRAGMERTAAILVAYYARQYGVSYETALAKLREGRPILAPLPNQAAAVQAWLKTKSQLPKLEFPKETG